MIPALPLRVTAVAPSPRLLSVVTVSWGGRALRLVPSATRFFELKNDDQAGVRGLADALFTYFHTCRISEILVRRGPRTGTHRMSSGAIVFETALQLLPLTCAHIGSRKVDNWVRTDWRLPWPQPGFKATVQGLQQSAIDTAAYGLAAILGQSFDDG